MPCCAATTMPSNVEIKARLENPERTVRVAKELSGGEGLTLKQDDTFFNVPRGRLKLRMEEGLPAKLISYSRADTAGPKLSDFSIALINNPNDLRMVLTEALGILGCVKKTRELFLVGQTRIHIDRVEGLGDFVELEVVMMEGQTVAEGQRIAEDLMTKLGISEDCLVTGAYMDLLLQK